MLLWVVGGSIGGPFFGRVDQVATNDQSSFLPQSADATRVSERLTDFTGSDTIPAIVVATTSDGSALSDAQVAALQSLATDIAAVEGVAGDASPPVVSDDGQAAQIFVPIDSSGEVREVVEQVRERVSAQVPAGVEAWVTGPAGFTSDLVKGFLGIDGLLLVVALAAVFVILVIVYRSPLLPILVLLTSVFALCVALLTVWWLAYAGIVVLNGQVQGILFILVIGAATDYALLYVARFREAVGEGLRRWDATTRAWRGAFEPILASGGTVIAGLLCLLLSDLATNRALGPIASIGIAFAVLSALTFLPALLALVGRAAFWPFLPKPGRSALPADLTQPVKGLWPRQARLVARRARPIWVICTLVLLAACVGITQLRADGVPASDLVLGASRRAMGRSRSPSTFRAAPAVLPTCSSPRGRPLGPCPCCRTPRGSRRSRCSAPTPPAAGVGDRGRWRPADDGARCPRAPRPVPDGFRRRCAAGRHPRRHGRFVCGGRHRPRQLRTAVAVELGRGDGAGGRGDRDRHRFDRHVDPRPHTDHSDRARGDPADPHGAAALDRRARHPHRYGHRVVRGRSRRQRSGVRRHPGFPGADPAVPLYGFVFLVALGVDYNIFLMSRVREESLAHGTRAGILRGLVATGGVITSAGLVLAATFAALGVIPILFLAQLAFIVAFGVLLDTFVVRSLLVPALAYDLGRRIWWPSKLGRADAETRRLDA